jgi:hypothetical protein
MEAIAGILPADDGRILFCDRFVLLAGGRVTP